MISLNYAPEAWKCLNGIICVYKPPSLATIAARNTICFNLSRDLNQLLPRKETEIVCLNGSVYSKKPFQVELRPNLAQHELVSGARYQPDDVRMKWLSCLGINTSGVTLMAINDGCKHLSTYDSFLGKYEIEGKFGIATNNFLINGKVIERSSSSHVRQSSLDRVLASIQASHQSLAYSYLGVDIQSQAAYDLASKGLVRPTSRSDPIVYSIKCVACKLPNFTLEVYCINETETFLTELIHDIGIDLKTNAVCTRLRRIQFGHFTLSHALLRKHWTLPNIINNITLCQAMLQGQTPQHISQLKQKNLIEAMQTKVREEYID